MKLQYLAVIFVVIIIPISFVMSEYVQTQIDTIRLQTLYRTSLNNATYDALKAFQINSTNNKYSSISDSKIRDIEASINTFYNSLGASMENYVSSKEELSVFIPAILFTLYDGYYINSSYENIYEMNENGKVEIKDTNQNYQSGLRPYIYYSCTYHTLNGNVIVNYTLDNAITVYGNFGNGYETRSGYLINPKDVVISPNSNNKGVKTLQYKDLTIGPEILTEHLITIEDADTGTVREDDYNYIVFNNRKVYQDKDKNGNIEYEDTIVPKYTANGEIQYDDYNNIITEQVSSPKYFWYENYKKTYLKSEKVDLLKYLDDNGVGFRSISAFEYYKNAKEFSEWINSNLNSINQDSIVQNDGTVGSSKDGKLYLSVDTSNKYIFELDGKNDPTLSDSIFNTHRMAVIRKSIETNLTTAIANYNVQSGSNYEFVMPIIDEENWYQITNNVSIISFMQGLPIGYKYFNQYAVITNTKNEEVINEQSVYIVAKDKSGNLEYHQPGCKELINGINAGTLNIENAYTDLSFLRQTVKISEANIQYFYPQARKNAIITGCYNCIVNATADYDIDDIIQGEIKDKSTNKTIYNKDDKGLRAVRETYLRALARERYILNNLIT